MGQGPGDVRWAEQAERRDVEPDAEVAGAAVGGDEQARSPDACLGQAEAHRLVRQADDVRPVGQPDDGSGGGALAGSADDREDAADVGLIDESPGQGGEVGLGPAFSPARTPPPCSRRRRVDPPANPDSPRPGRRRVRLRGSCGGRDGVRLPGRRGHRRWPGRRRRSAKGRTSLDRPGSASTRRSRANRAPPRA